jgi:lysophospholipase L1-like esterase
LESRIFPPARSRLASHAHRATRHHRQRALLFLTAGLVAISFMTLGSASGVVPRGESAVPSMIPLTFAGHEVQPVPDTTAEPGSRLDAADSASSACPTKPDNPASGPGTVTHPGISSPPVAVKRARGPAVILGDSYSSGYVGAGLGANGWPAIVSAAFGWQLHNLAVPGTGFVNPGWTAQPFGTMVAEAIRLHPGVVIVAGGHNDRRYGTSRTATAAGAVLDRLRSGLPDAVIVVVGPIWFDGSPATSIVALRDYLRKKAASIHALFIDPLRPGWFAGASHRFIGPDGIHPTDAGHRHIAQLVLAALRADPRFAPASTALAAPEATPQETRVPSIFRAAGAQACAA